jgi:micrococcal nuclease
MNKLIISVIGLFLFCSSLFGETDPIVFVLKSSRKYHRESCPVLRGSKIAVRLSEAVKKKYQPCEKCKPDTLHKSESYSDNHIILLRVNKPPVDSYTKVDMNLLVRAEVVKVEDGDTVTIRIDEPPKELAREEKVRLLGVDTPEMNTKEGKIARQFVVDRLFHQLVFIACDWNLRDKYKRLLAYLYLANGECFNVLLIREGMSPAYIKYRFQFLKEFAAIELETKRLRRGFWASEGFMKD